MHLPLSINADYLRAMAERASKFKLSVSVPADDLLKIINVVQAAERFCREAKANASQCGSLQEDLRRDALFTALEGK